jgi:hypothetical protein
MENKKREKKERRTQGWNKKRMGKMMTMMRMKMRMTKVYQLLCNCQAKESVYHRETIETTSKYHK